jgi:hypothetical protein
MADTVNISTIRAYFDNEPYPPGPVRLDQCTVITDTKKFVENSLETLESHPGCAGYAPYYNRLLDFYTLCINQ